PLSCGPGPVSAQALSRSGVSSERFASLPRQAGEARWWFGDLALIKLTGKQAEGRFSLLEVLWPPNLEVSLRVHSREEERFYVLEGKISCPIGASRFEASPGHTLLAPQE